MKNTDAIHLPSDVFSTPGLILEVNRTLHPQYNVFDQNGDGASSTTATDPSRRGRLQRRSRGRHVLDPLVIRDNRHAGPDTNYLRYTGGDHVVLGGTGRCTTS